MMYKSVENYIKKGIYPFHMPGHKGNPFFLPPNLLGLDITEIPGMDVLSQASGILKKFQDDIAALYGADYSFFLVNGSSAGIVAAVCYACPCIVIPRNAHVSVFHGLGFCDVMPYYVATEVTDCGLCGGVLPESLVDIPHGAAVFIVSPTYEGFVSDIAGIAEVVHSKGGILIVDEAHGAHFPFHEKFPDGALKNGADIVINSFHKTLPALSQTAVFHVKGNRVDVKRLQYFINMVQTTSPSYMFMAATDYMLKLLNNQPLLFEKYVQRLEDFRKNSPGLTGAEIIGKYGIFDIDIGKLLFNTTENIEKILAEEYKLQVEMSSDRHLLAMTSVADTDEGFGLLKNAVNKLSAKLKYKQNTAAVFSAKQILTPYKALRMPSKNVPPEEAPGKISACVIADYPPGVVLIAPGEEIPLEFCQIREQNGGIDFVKIVIN